MNTLNDLDFPLYLSNVTIEEEDFVFLQIQYSGDEQYVNELKLIGKNNGLTEKVKDGLRFELVKKEGIKSFVVRLPIYEDGEFKAVAKYKNQYIHEPGEFHSLTIKGQSIFLDFRKIYHLQNELVKPDDATISDLKQKKKSSKKPTKTKDKTIEIPSAYDKDNNLELKPRDFKLYDESLRMKFLQILDYLVTEKSKNLELDGVILPDIVRSLKQCMTDEKRHSVFEDIFPVTIIIQKALMLSKMLEEVREKEYLIKSYKKEVVEAALSLKEELLNKQFISSNNIVLVEYNTDVQKLKKEFFKEL